MRGPNPWQTHWSEGFARRLGKGRDGWRVPGTRTRAMSYELTWLKKDPADRDGHRVFALTVWVRGLTDFDQYDTHEVKLGTLVMRRDDWDGEGLKSARGHTTMARRRVAAMASEVEARRRKWVRLEMAELAYEGNWWVTDDKARTDRTDAKLKALLKEEGRL